MARPEIRIGTSGWNYWHWTGLFYPEGLPRSRWLEYYQSKFDTLELNASFYRLPLPATFARWREASPKGFLWAVKAHRGITHYSRLKEREPLQKFLNAAKGLVEQLGVILFQLPPSLKFDARVVGRFLGWLPKGKRYAIEPRHASWFEPKLLELLARHNVAIAIADSGGRFPSGEHLTTEFAYVRFHGAEQLYASRYTTEQMRAWAEKLLEWKRPAFVYFNNDFHAYAVENALELKQEVARRACPERSRRGGLLRGTSRPR